MTKDVMISVKGLQFTGEGEPDLVETLQAGEYFCRNGSHFLLFEEYVEGFDKPIRNILRFKENELSITKKGLINTQLQFERGKKSLGTYRTPYGEIMMGMDTSHISILEDKQQLKLEVKYVLEADYKYVADCHIVIEATQRKNMTAEDME